MIVLDTHALVWWVSDPTKLSKRARSLIDGAIAEASFYVSSISCWEVAMLARKGRLELNMETGDWLSRVESLPFVRFVPADNRIALRSVELPAPFPDDPADRIIAATALTLGASLVTKDRRLHSVPPLKALW